MLSFLFCQCGTLSVAVEIHQHNIIQSCAWMNIILQTESTPMRWDKICTFFTVLADSYLANVDSILFVPFHIKVSPRTLECVLPLDRGWHAANQSMECSHKASDNPIRKKKKPSSITCQRDKSAW